MLLTGGGPHGCWAFTLAQSGVVLRKREAHATDLGHLQSAFLRVVAASPRPRLAVPRPPSAHSSSSSSSRRSVPPALAQFGVEPAAVVALAQGEGGGCGGMQRPLDALDLLQICQTGAFPPGARTIQAYVAEKGASIAVGGTAAAAAAAAGGEGAPTLVAGSTFHQEYSVGRLGLPLHRSSRCVSRSLFGGAGLWEKRGPGGNGGKGTTAVGDKTAAAWGGDEGELPLREDWADLGDVGGAGAPSSRGHAPRELELLPSTNRALNQAMVEAAQQVVWYVFVWVIMASVCAILSPPSKRALGQPLQARGERERRQGAEARVRVLLGRARQALAPAHAGLPGAGARQKDGCGGGGGGR